MTIEDLKKDEAALIAHMNQIQGAVAYIRQKIAALDQEAAKAKKKNGKAPDKVEAPVADPQKRVEA